LRAVYTHTSAQLEVDTSFVSLLVLAEPIVRVSKAKALTKMDQ